MEIPKQEENYVLRLIRWELLNDIRSYSGKEAY